MRIPIWAARQAVWATLFEPVHLKTRSAGKCRTLVSAHRLVVREIRKVENHRRGTLKAFGLKTGKTRRRRFEPRIHELVAGNTALAEVADGLLQIRRVLLDRLEVYDRKVLEIVRNDAVCRRLMTTPGVGPIVALSYRTAMDTPARFAKSRNVGAYFGLTPRRYQSGEVNRSGRISKVGDGSVRAVLYEAATVLLRRSARPSALKSWGMRVARRRGHKRAVVAVARKLAIVLHRMWMAQDVFRWPPPPGRMRRLRAIV